MNYLNSRPNSHGLFSETDDPIVLDKVAKAVANHSDALWTHIVSLKREDAERMGYTDLDHWRDLVRRHISDIAEAQKIAPENIRWYAAFHNKESNPHVHIVVYSADGKQGYLTKDGIDKIRSAFANDIYKDELQNLYQQQTAVRDQLRSEAKSVMKKLLSELHSDSFENPQLEQLVLKLQTQLRNSKGKKVYGYLQPNVKKTVDQIVSQLAQNPVLKKMYEEWCKLEQQKYETYTSIVQKFQPLEENKVFKPIKNAVIRAVLEMDFSTEMFAEYDENEIDEAESNKGLYIRWTAEYKSACSKLYKKRDVPKALEMFRSEADKGNILAFFDIGKMYRNGLLGNETLSGKCMRSAMARNRTTPKRSFGLKNPRRQEISLRNTRSAACIFTGTERHRITRKRLNIISCPPIRIMLTLATKLRKCSVTVSALKKMPNKRKYISKGHITDF